MIWSITKKEILENLVTYRFFILTGLLAILMAVSVFVSYGDYELRLENYTILKPSNTSVDVIVPPNPLSIFARGLDANIGRLLEISLFGVQVHSSQQSINRLFSLFTVPDMLFIIKVILAVIALLFSFDAICGEKEQGTLKLILASGSSKLNLLFGKLFGRFLLVFIPFVILFLLSIVVISMLPNIQIGNALLTRLAIIVLVSGLYTLIFIAIGIFISSLVNRSATSMIFSLGIWVMLVFVIPSMGGTIAKSISDIPPAERIEMESRLSSIKAIYERIQNEKQSARGNNAYIGMVNQLKEVNSRLFESYKPRLSALLNLTQSIMRISPSGSLTFFISDIAGTGIYEEQRLKDAVIRHVNRNFNRIADLENSPIENFTYHPAPVDEVMAKSSLSDLIVLLFVNMLFLGFSILGFLAYDPR